MTLAKRDFAGMVFALAIAVGCVRFGVWQLDRLRERRARNAAVLAARERLLLEVTGTLAADSARERRLRASGVYDYDHERRWRARSYEGVPGVALITPLRLADGSAVLVDRGWVPSPDAFHVDPHAYREADTADVLGVGMVAPRARGDVDPSKLKDSLPYRLLSFVVQQLPSDGPPVGPSDHPLPPGLRRWPMPELSNGPHLSYAVQWFSFAAIIVVGSVALLRKRVREG